MLVNNRTHKRFSYAEHISKEKDLDGAVGDARVVERQRKTRNGTDHGDANSSPG